MIANRRNLSEIFSPPQQLVAPLFQRPYVWNRESNWAPMWEAIRETADRRLGEGKSRPHFLGAIVLAQIGTPTGIILSREIIDGQQRLTTLQLAMSAARDVLLELGQEHWAQHFRNLTTNHIQGESSERFKVWPTNRDREEFREAVSEGTIKRAEGNGNLVDGYHYFAREVGLWLGEKVECLSAAAQALTSVFSQDLVLVAIDLDQEDDGQLIFETLNALGTPLLPSDLVKNLLFHESEKQDCDSERFYEQYWKEFDHNSGYWREELKIGRLKRPRIDAFLQHYLTLKCGRHVLVEQAFRAYRELFLDGAWPSIEGAFADFRNHAERFRDLERPAAGTIEADFQSRFWVVDSQAVYPLLLGFYVHAPQEDRSQFLRDIESYFFRRMVCQLSQKSTTNVVGEAITWMRQSEWSAQSARQFFLTREGDRGRWPDDEEVTRAVIHKPLYWRVQVGRLAALLKFYERTLHTDKTDPIIYTGDVSVEHVMPRKWQDHWPLTTSEEKEGQDRTWYVDTIGNLTLVTQKLNSSLSNGPWGNKREALKKHTLLSLTKEILEHEVWDLAHIKQRSRRISDAFLSLWPRPEGGQTLLQAEGEVTTLEEVTTTEEESVPIESEPDSDELTVDDVMRVAASVIGKPLLTMGERSDFTITYEGGDLVIQPSSSGSSRPLKNQLDAVVSRYNNTHSLKPADYQDISHNSSYVLRLIQMAEEDLR